MRVFRTNVVLPAPLGPTTKSNRCMEGPAFSTLGLQRRSARGRPGSRHGIRQSNSGAVGPILDQIPTLVERHRGQALRDPLLPVVGNGEVLLNGRRNLSIEDRPFLTRELAHRQLTCQSGLDPAALRASCLLYTSDAADDLLCVDLGGRRLIKKKKNKI